MDRITTPIERDEARLDEALAWYENGTLSEADREWVEALLERDPDAKARLAFDRGIAAAFERRHAELPADLGWSKLIQKVRADAATATAVGRAPAAAPGGSVLQRFADWFGGLMTPQLGTALAVLFAVQTVAIGYLLTDRNDYSEFRTAGDQKPVAVIRAILDEKVSEKLLRETLTANGATIVDGPNQLGEYWILAPERDIQGVAKALKDAGVIANFVIDQRLQAR